MSLEDFFDQKLGTKKEELKKIERTPITPIPVSKHKKFSEWLKLNRDHLENCISWSINTIKNKKEVKEKDLDKQYYRNYVKWNELREFIRNKVSKIE